MMAARAIAGATVSFGLVTVPVKLYSSAETSGNISFNLVHEGCGSRLKQQYICAKDGEIVERDQMVKGYEFSKGQYVLFSNEELKAIEAKADNTIAIEEFVPRDQVDRVYIDRVYYLGPDKGGDRPYRLLAAAMRETGLSALGRYAARGKQYLVLLSPLADGMVMEQLHYAHEVRPFAEVPIGSGEVKPQELKLAIQLVEQVASEQFDPVPYKDDVRERVLELIQKKVEGEDITEAPEAEPQTQVIDLMEALKASLARTEQKGAAAERKPAKRAASAQPKEKTGAKGSGSRGRRKASGAS
ncbi:MAG: Ku protein [Longimicrobiales bacterium]